MTANLPDRPAYFSYDVGMNLEGAEPFSALPPLDEMTEEELKHAVQRRGSRARCAIARKIWGGTFPGQH